MLLESAQLGARLGALFEESVRPVRAFRVALAGPGEETGIIWIADEAGTEVRYDHEPHVGFWRRLLSKLLGAFAPEDLL